MKCEHTYESLHAMHHGSQDEHEQRQLQSHLEWCEDCAAAAEAASALWTIREQPPVEPPPGLFERVMRRSRLAGRQLPVRSRFWVGAGVGAAVAASVMVAIMTSSLLPSRPPVRTSEVQLALGVPREVNIAIEMKRNLPDATITVALTGGIELDGYPGRKELSWKTDLEAGVNRLTLPLVAVDGTGGQLLVRVGHGNRERRFTLDLKLDS